MVIFFDIETYGPEPRGALNPVEGKIITIQVRHHGRNIVWKEWARGWDELKLIRSFLDFLSDHRKEPLVGDVLLEFDLPFLLCRLIHHEGEIQRPGRYLLIYQRRWFDLYQILLDGYVGVKDWAAKKLGLRSRITGEDIPKLYKKKRYSEILAYVNDELRKMEFVYNWVVLQPWYKDLEQTRRGVVREGRSLFILPPTLPQKVLRKLQASASVSR